MKSFVGKGLIKNHVILHLYRKKFDLVYEYGNEKEAKKAFNSFEYEKKSFTIFKYLQIKICKHEEEYDLEVGFKKFYRVCKKCNRGLYTDRTTTEEMEENRHKMIKLFRKTDILDLKEDIIRKEKLLEKLKLEYESTYNEDYNKDL